MLVLLKRHQEKAQCFSFVWLVDVCLVRASPLLAATSSLHTAMKAASLGSWAPGITSLVPHHESEGTQCFLS